MGWQTILKVKTLKGIYDDLMSRSFVLPLNQLEIFRSSQLADGSPNPEYSRGQMNGGRHDFVYALETYEGARTEYEETISAKYTELPPEIEAQIMKQYYASPEGLGALDEKIGDYTVRTRRAVNHDMDDMFIEFNIVVTKGQDFLISFIHQLDTRVDEEYARSRRIDAETMRQEGQDVGDLKMSTFADQIKF